MPAAAAPMPMPPMGGGMPMPPPQMPPPGPMMGRKAGGRVYRTYKDMDPTWTDLTNYVEWEGGDVQLEVGALPRQSR